MKVELTSLHSERIFKEKGYFFFQKWNSTTKGEFEDKKHTKVYLQSPPGKSHAFSGTMFTLLYIFYRITYLIKGYYCFNQYSITFMESINVILLGRLQFRLLF